MFESKSGVFLIGGVFFFFLAFVIMAWVPIAIFKDKPELSAQDLAEQGIIHEFIELAEKYPKQFEQHYKEVNYETYASALERGHEIFVAEGCWHCHSQFIRPVSNEDIRWGPRSFAMEYQNEFQRPVLFGTRRVGPDLFREGARKSNDWHIAHFYNPRSVVPLSVMPEYTWFFDSEGYLNKDGMAILTYVQWLGSWHEQYPYWRGEGPPKPIEVAPDEESEEDELARASAVAGEEGA